MRVLVLTLVFEAIRLTAASTPAEHDQEQLRDSLRQIADFIIDLNITDGATHGRKYNTTFPGGAWGTVEGRRSIFQVGNLARVLLAASQVLKEPRYLEMGLSWCDNFVSRQHDIATSVGDVGGYWGCGYGCMGGNWYHAGVHGEAVCNDGAEDMFDGDGWVLLADTGTAVTALLLGTSLTETGSRRHLAYTSALRKYALFVRNGCHNAPAGCEACPSGWVNEDGGVGVGFFGRDPQGKMRLDNQSYTVATALTGTVFPALLNTLESGDVKRSLAPGMAMAALEWLLGTIDSDGSIPDIIDGVAQHGNESIPYATEAFVAAQLFVPDAPSALVASRLNATVHYLVRTQSSQGGWEDVHHASSPCCNGTLTLSTPTMQR